MSNGRRFELKRRLGAGSFGHVFLADMVSQGGFRKQVALKMLRPGLGASSDAGRRLRDEARVLGRLRHRHIVRVDDLVQLDDRWAMVMEYVPGMDLEELTEAFPELSEGVSPRVACEMVAAVASALDVAYNDNFGQPRALRLVHRDIKPSNVRLSPDGQLKVLDFGIARAEFEEREASTEQVRYGSIPYMSPERLLGEEETTAGDIYSLGSIFVELLVGTRFGKAPLREADHDARREELVGKVRARLPEAPELGDLIDRCLRYDPAPRPDAAEVMEISRACALDLGGDTLEVWARRLFQGSTLEEGIPLDGEIQVLQERSSGGSALVGPDLSTLAAAPARGAPTIIPDDYDEAGGYVGTGESSRGEGPAGTETSEVEAEGTPNRRLLLGIPLIIGAVLAVVAGLVFLPSAGELSPGAQGPAAGAAPILAEAEATVTQEPSAAPEAATDAATLAAPPDELTTAAGSQEEPPSEASIPSGSASTRAKEPARKPGGNAGAAAPPASASSGTAQEPDAAQAAEAVATTPPSGELLRAVKFTANGATAVRASCGEVQTSGASSALVRNIPPGSCTVEADLDGQTHSTRVSVTSPKGFTCGLQGEDFRCL